MRTMTDATCARAAREAPIDLDTPEDPEVRS